MAYRDFKAGHRKEPKNQTIAIQLKLIRDVCPNIGEEAKIMDNNDENSKQTQGIQDSKGYLSVESTTNTSIDLMNAASGYQEKKNLSTRISSLLHPSSPSDIQLDSLNDLPEDPLDSL